MTKIEIVSGFLGAGKTTLIKKLLKEIDLDKEIAELTELMHTTKGQKKLKVIYKEV